MPINFTDHEAVLSGVCQVEEAEHLRRWLAEHKGARVNLGQLTYVHTAVLQVLMAGRPPVQEWPANAGLSRDIAAILDTGKDTVRELHHSTGTPPPGK